MNFGQRIPGIEQVPYRIEMDETEFIETIREGYEKFLSETIDDEPFDDGSFAEINELREMGWPALDELWKKNPTLLLDNVKAFLKFELLDASLPFSFHEMVEPAYQINGLDRIEKTDGCIMVFGEAYEFSP